MTDFSRSRRVAAKARRVMPVGAAVAAIVFFASGARAATPGSAEARVPARLSLDCFADTSKTEAGAQTPMAFSGWGIDPQASVLLLDVPASSPTPSPATAAPKSASPWRLTLELPIWIPSLSGMAAARGFSSPIRTSLGNAFESNDTLVGLVGRVEVGYGKWTVVADCAYLKWENNVTGPGGADINFRAETFLVDIDIFYRIGEWQLGAAKSPDDVPASLVLDIGPGMRYVHVGLNLDAVHGASHNQTQDWADPVAAMRAILALDKHWQTEVRADIGGGVNADLTWSTAVLFSYNFRLCSQVTAAVELGYKAVGEDYQSGSGSRAFKWDVVVHGPVIGLALKF